MATTFIIIIFKQSKVSSHRNIPWPEKELTIEV